MQTSQATGPGEQFDRLRLLLRRYREYYFREARVLEIVNCWIVRFKHDLNNSPMSAEHFAETVAELDHHGYQVVRGRYDANEIRPDS